MNNNNSRYEVRAAKSIVDSSIDYHCDTSTKVFEEWFENKLLPNILPNKNIVVDNASYHSRYQQKKIIYILFERDICFHESYHVKQLLKV